MNPTPKQINYAMYLLHKNGYSTRYMSARFSALSATMKERSGTVKGWLEGMNRFEISDLIKELL